MFLELSVGYILFEVFPPLSAALISIAFNRFTKSNKSELFLMLKFVSLHFNFILLILFIFHFSLPLLLFWGNFLREICNYPDAQLYDCIKGYLVGKLL